MNVKQSGNKLIIEIEAQFQNPPQSKSGKSRLVASTNGAMATTLEVAGQPLVINLNAYVPAR